MPNFEEMPKHFEPKEREREIYQRWEQNGYFKAHVNPAKKSFTIVMPPPNITSQLHIGHALDNTFQDAFIRYHRMLGEEALWIPGVDHAAIATEAKIVEQLRSEGLTKQDIGYDAYMKRAYAWKEKYAGRIIEQLRYLGSSCDWDRCRFTMDEGFSQAVLAVFVKYYEKGYIYRGKRIINWCPNCRTSISDAEVNFSEQEGNLWYIRYEIENEPGRYITVATTRPETILGDTAVAVNPADARFSDLVNKRCRLPLLNRWIPIVADDYVEQEFGTGCVKITPAHDPNDYEVGLRHNLPVINIMDDSANINSNGGIYAGLNRDEARRRIVEDLEKSGNLVKIEAYKHNVGSCYRCHKTIEPRLSEQWFVKMKDLADKALKAAADGDVTFVPSRFKGIYDNWMNNIRDWCISRQLWWGHRIPAWYCQDCGEINVSLTVPTTCSKCQSKNLLRDNDTLDTWFSSALWPFGVFGWPNFSAPGSKEEFSYFYPTDILVTGYDIIFFWVARMIFQSLELTGKAPFHHVLLHGLMRDANGIKMSKSLNNGVDPLKIIDEYGADALRYAIVSGTASGNDQRYSKEKLETARAFINKLWNALRFILGHLDAASTYPTQADLQNLLASPALKLEDRWILQRVNSLIDNVNNNFCNYEIGTALDNIYSFFWNEYCDWYVEIVKSRLFDTADSSHQTALQCLRYVLESVVRLLHPFMPFVTEEIYQYLPNHGETIMLESWPQAIETLNAETAVADMNMLIQGIREIRNLRAEKKLKPSLRFKVSAYTDNEHISQLLHAAVPYFERLCGVSSIEFLSSQSQAPKLAVTIVLPQTHIYIPLSELIDLEEEKQRLATEREQLEKEKQRLENKLANSEFVNKAPAKVVENERAKLTVVCQKLTAVNARIVELG